MRCTAPVRTSAVVAIVAATTLSTAACTTAEPSVAFDAPVEIVVPFAQGGPTDTIARIVAARMAETLEVDVDVRNVEGEGGVVGSAEVAAAEPDGLTLLTHHIGLSTAPTLNPDLPFDPVADFAPVGLMTAVPMTIVTRSDLGPTDLDELVAAGAAAPGQLTIATAGASSASGLCSLLLQDALGVQFTPVTFDGTGPALEDLIDGKVDVMCDQTVNTGASILDGSIHALAITTPWRTILLDDVPTVAEAGRPELEISAWQGLYAPAGTPDDVIAALNSAMREALDDPEVQQQFADLGTAPAAEAQPEVLAKLLSQQIEEWSGLLQSHAG